MWKQVESTRLAWQWWAGALVLVCSEAVGETRRVGYLEPVIEFPWRKWAEDAGNAGPGPDTHQRDWSMLDLKWCFGVQVVISHGQIVFSWAWNILVLTAFLDSPYISSRSKTAFWRTSSEAHCLPWTSSLASLWWWVTSLFPHKKILWANSAHSSAVTGLFDDKAQQLSCLQLSTAHSLLCESCSSLSYTICWTSSSHLLLCT